MLIVEGVWYRPYPSHNTLGPQSKPITPRQAGAVHPGLLSPPRPDDGLIRRYASAPCTAAGGTGSLSPSAIVQHS